jgi:hypothetical protein
METVVTHGGANGLPEVTSELVARPEARRERRRGGWPLAVYVVSALLVVGAAVMASSARQTRSSADEARDRTQVSEQRQADAREAARAADAVGGDLVTQVRTVERSVEGWAEASNRYLDARDDFVAAGNAAIDLGNAGDFDGELARFEGEVSDLLAGLEPLLVEVQSGRDQVDADVRRLDRLVAELEEENR